MKDGIRYFFLDGDLFRVFRHYRPTGLADCYNYTKHEYQAVFWADARKRMKQAFSIPEAARVFGVVYGTLWNYIGSGKIPKPQYTYKIDSIYRTPSKYFISEDDMMDIHEYMLTRWENHPLHPHKMYSGVSTPDPRTPSRAEILAKMKRGEVLYAKVGKDEYVPVWRSPEW